MIQIIDVGRLFCESRAMSRIDPKLLEARVPRYTSYPTAPHFQSEIGADAYGEWLASLDGSQAASLYAHVPFCAEMCWYCGCFTKIVNRYDPVRSYADALLAEAAMVADRTGARVPVNFMHWGGGSPTMLVAEDWLRLMNGLRERFDFLPGAEVAVEMDPRGTTPEYVAALRDAGVTRVSIGVQDFDPEVQKAINRDQPFEVTRRVVDWLRDAGIRSVNLDLMYGLPFQTTERVDSMVDLALTLEPERIALFGYAHVPWMKSHQKMIPTEALPGTAERWEQHNLAAGKLHAAGFERIGFDHFARPDDSLAQARQERRLKRNFQGYTTDAAEVLIGLGASAIGSLNEGYVQNVAAIRDYQNRIAEGRLATSRGRRLSADDKLRRDVINAVMCDLEVDVGEVCRQHGLPESELDAELPLLAPYEKDGLMHLDGRHIDVTESGRPLVRLIAAVFDSYLQPEQARHAVAV